MAGSDGGDDDWLLHFVGVSASSDHRLLLLLLLMLLLLEESTLGKPLDHSGSTAAQTVLARPSLQPRTHGRTSLHWLPSQTLAPTQ
jgi:hypothetical protein